MTVITLLNEKGGVGKTSLAVTLAVGLAIYGGLRVILIDADPQGSATHLLGKPSRPAFYDWLVRNAGIETVLDTVSVGETSIGLIAGNVESRNIESMIDDAMLLRERIAELQADAIIIDTPPTPSLLHAAVYLASDFILYPTKPEHLSLNGLANSLSHLQKVQKTRINYGLPAVALLGIIPTLYRSQTVMHQINLETMQSQFGDRVWEPIPMRTAWVEASSIPQPIFIYEPTGQASQDGRLMVDRVLAEVFNGQTS